ncbi:MAG: metal ABC transporter substrate-binding protein [Pseudomonadota bacterium]
MNYKNLLLIILGLCFARPSVATNIVTSITPVASLASMIAGGRAKVINIANDPGCPHHYSLKPSDIKNFENADLFIYIDEKFDGFAAKILPQIYGHVLHIGGIAGLKIENNNWHLWLLPQNAMIILEEITKLLCQISPENKAFFEHNLALNIEKLQQLELKRQSVMSSISDTIILSDSVEYLFDQSTKCTKFYQSYEHLSVKAMNDLSGLSKKSNLCFITDGQSLGRYRKLLGRSAHLIGISSENWAPLGALDTLYFREYDKILDEIKAGCRSSE